MKRLRMVESIRRLLCITSREKRTLQNCTTVLNELTLIQGVLVWKAHHRTTHRIHPHSHLLWGLRMEGLELSMTENLAESRPF